MNSNRLIIIFVVITLIGSNTCSGLKCFQCGLTGRPDCDDPSSNELLECPSTENNYCTFEKAIVNEVSLVRKMCSSTGDANCEGMNPNPEQPIYQASCGSYSCNRDGCNGSGPVKLNIVVMTIMVVYAWILS